MNLNSEISWIQKEILKVEDPDLISAIKYLLKSRTSKDNEDWWQQISEEERASIKRGLLQAEAGNTIGHEEVMAKYAKWL